VRCGRGAGKDAAPLVSPAGVRPGIPGAPARTVRPGRRDGRATGPFGPGDAGPEYVVRNPAGGEQGRHRAPGHRPRGPRRGPRREARGPGAPGAEEAEAVSNNARRARIDRLAGRLADQGVGPCTLCGRAAPAAEEDDVVEALVAVRPGQEP